MKIDVYSNMYNEERMLPYWLRHYETIADRIFVWDDYSNDSTRKILKKHPKVTILLKGKVGQDNDYNSEVLYPQYEQYSRGVSDWVIVVDADEFIYHPNLRKILKELREDDAEVIQCKGFDMISDKFPTTDGQIYDEIKMGIESNLMTKWAIHSPDIHLRYRRGRHGRPHDERNWKHTRYRYAGIKLLHYRYLGKEYTEQRDRSLITGKNRAPTQPYVKYSSNRIRTCPDKTKGNIYEWLDLHKKDIVNIIDSKRKWTT